MAKKWFLFWPAETTVACRGSGSRVGVSRAVVHADSLAQAKVLLKSYGLSASRWTKVKSTAQEQLSSSIDGPIGWEEEDVIGENWITVPIEQYCRERFGMDSEREEKG